MTLTQYKKIISALPREELEAHLVDLFKTNRVFKDIESTTWAVDENSFSDGLIFQCEVKD